MPLRLSMALACALWGCSSGCGEDGPLVPFKLDGKSPVSETTTGGPAPEAEPTDGVTYPEQTASVTVRGHTLSVKDHAVRATLEADLNQDARRDLLLVLQDERGAPRLATALADAEGLGTIELKSALAGEGESCTVATVALSRLSATFALIRMRLACGEIEQQAQDEAPARTYESPPAPPEPGEPAPATERKATEVAQPLAPQLQAPQPLDVLVRIDGEPSIVETLRLDEPPPAVDPGRQHGTRVEAGWSAGDIDADDHIDLTVQLTTRFEDTEPVSVAIHFLDRPSGLALDTSAAEKVWLALADEAKQARKSQPDRAHTLASRAFWSHRAICREAGHAMIELGSERGIPCGASLAAGRSGSIEAAVDARRGRLLGALERIELLHKSSVYELTENDRERMRYAIAERTRTVVWRAGPTAVLGAAPAVRRSAIAFLDEHRLLVRGTQGATAHDLATGAAEPASAELADVVVRDPAGKRAIVALTARCEGVHAAIVHASQVVAGVSTGAPIAEPLLWPSGRSGAECAAQAAAAPSDAPELQVIGWTRSGIVIAASGMVWLVPIDASNETSAPLWPSAEVLAELGPSPIGIASRTALVPTDAGLALATADGKASLLAWPEGIARSTVTDVAVSPSGKRVAVLSSGRVLISDLAAQAAPAAPPSGEPPAPPEPEHAR